MLMGTDFATLFLQKVNYLQILHTLSKPVTCSNGSFLDKCGFMIISIRLFVHFDVLFDFK